MAAAVELAAERQARNAQTKEASIRAAARRRSSRDADACAAARDAGRVAATPLESDPAADTRRALREKRAALREQQALLAAWTRAARANAAGDVGALAAVTNEAGPVAAAAARALAACERLGPRRPWHGGVGWRGVAAGDAERAPLDRKCVRRLATACRRLERLDELHGRPRARWRRAGGADRGPLRRVFLQETDDAADDDGGRRDKPEWPPRVAARVARGAGAAKARGARRGKLGEAVGACARAKLPERCPSSTSRSSPTRARLDEEVASSHSALAVPAATRARRDAWRAADTDGAPRRAAASSTVRRRRGRRRRPRRVGRPGPCSCKPRSSASEPARGALRAADPVARKGGSRRGRRRPRGAARAAPRWDEVRDIEMVGWSRAGRGRSRPWRRRAAPALWCTPRRRRGAATRPREGPGGGGRAV